MVSSLNRCIGNLGFDNAGSHEVVVDTNEIFTNNRITHFSLHLSYAASDALPTTLQASESSGGASLVTFQRVIVMPDGQKWVEGVTPKQLPAPTSVPPETTAYDDVFIPDPDVPLP
jgi:hypothetical protein